MAYTKTDWKNRQVQYPRRYALEDKGGGISELTPTPGEVYEPGVPANAENLNKMERGIFEAHENIETHVHDGITSAKLNYSNLIGDPPTSVHIGTEAPTNANVQIWMDTTDGKNIFKVKNANGDWVAIPFEVKKLISQEAISEGGVLLPDKYAARQHGHDNFFDNPDFRNPVNQRGITGDFSTVDGVPVDRWNLYTGTVTVNEDNLVLAEGAAFEQRILGHRLAGEIVCISMLLPGKVIKHGVGTFPTTIATSLITIEGFGTVTLGYHADYMYVRFTAAVATTLLYVKGERGTVCTIENDYANYDVELYKCRRYYRNDLDTCENIMIHTANAVAFTISIVPAMVAIPTITLQHLSTIVYIGGIGTYTPSSYSFSKISPHSFITYFNGAFSTSGRPIISRESEPHKLIASCEP